MTVRAILLLAGVIVWALTTWVRPDTLTGEVRGVVLDVETGTPLKGAHILLENTSRGWRKETTTDLLGRYTFLQLEPGNYTVTARVGGYYTSTKTDILIRLNRLKVIVPPFELRRLVSTPTRQMTLRGELTKTAIVDLSAVGPVPAILAITREPGETSLISLGETGLRFNFDRRLLLGLPLRGTRSFDQLALLAPGVFHPPQSSGSGPAVGNGVGALGQFSVNGSRGRSNNFTVDGSDNNDEDIGMRRQGFVAPVPQAVESVQEFQIMTAGFPPEFGRNGGSMVNAVSRSGGGNWHGTLVGLAGAELFSAASFFDRPFRDEVNAGDLNGGTFSDARRRSFVGGAALGGPIAEDRLFLFVSAERSHRTGTALGHFIVPTATERGLRTREGTIPIDELQTFFDDYGVPYSSLAGQGVFALYPLPNNRSGPFRHHTYSQSRDFSADGFTGSARLDWNANRIHSLEVRYNFTDDRSVLPFTGQAIDSTLATRTRTQNLAWFLNSTTSTLANALRISYGRTALGFPTDKSSPLLFGSSAVEGVPGTAAPIQTAYGRFGPFGATGPIGRLEVLPYSPIGIDVFNFPQGRVDNTYQWSDFVSLSRGNHQWKWGFDVRRSQLNSFSDRNSRPLVLFAPGLVSQTCQNGFNCLFATPDGLLLGTDAAALGAPSALLQTLSTQSIPDSSLGLDIDRIELFAQDEWRIGDRLMLSYGLRYEYQSVPHDRQERIEATFGRSPDEFAHLEPTGSTEDRIIIENGNRAFNLSLASWNDFLGNRNGIYRPDRNNWSPRIGVAWDPSGAGRVVLRAGYNLLFDADLGAVTSRSRSVFPTFVPLNLDLSFSSGFSPDGRYLSSPSFLEFRPTGDPLIRPGTLNVYNLTDGAFATGLGTLFSQSPPFPGAALSSNGLAFTLPEGHFQTATVQTVYAGLEGQFRRDHHWSVRYVGTHSSHLTRFLTPNGGAISLPVLYSSATLGPLLMASLPPTVDPAQLGRPDPNLGAYTIFTNSAPAAFHSMQFSWERRFRSGFQFRGSWTWSHALDQVSDPFDARGFFALPQELGRLDREWASASFDARHRLSGFLIWELPWTGNRWVRDWRLSAIAAAQTGQPFTVNTALDRNLDGNLTDRLDRLTGILRSPGSVQQIDIAAGTKPQDLIAPRGQSGRVGRNNFRTAGMNRIDFAVSRRLEFSEERSLDLRAELFNVLNSTSFGIPVRLVDSPAFGASFDQQAEPRSLRWMVRFFF